MFEPPPMPVAPHEVESGRSDSGGERGTLPLTLALSLLALAGGLAVQRWVLQDFPTSADEYAYVWQAQALAGGLLQAEAPQPLETFAFFHLGEHEGLRYSRFPVGWPLLLTPLTMLGWAGLTTPLLGALATAGMHRVGVRWVGVRAATWGVLWGVLSPFFLLNVGSYHSHPASLALLVGLAWALVRGQEAVEGRASRSGALGQGQVGVGLGWACLAGFCLGGAVLVRPYTALLLGLPLLGFMRRFFSLERLVAFGVGGLPAAGTLWAVNEAITGYGWRLPTVLYDPQEGLGFGVHGHSFQQGAQNTLLWSMEGLGYTFFMTPLLLFFARGRAGAYERLLWVLLLAPVLGYLFYWNPGGFRYGPRFWFEALFPFVLLVGVGFEEVKKRILWRKLLPLFGVLGVLALGKLLHDEARRVEVRRTLWVKLEQTPLEGAIILLLNSHGDLPVYDLTRNPPAFRAQPVLFGRGRGAADAEVAAAWPDRVLYYYRWDERGGRLWPYDPHRLELPDPLPDK